MEDKPINQKELERQVEFMLEKLKKTPKVLHKAILCDHINSILYITDSIGYDFGDAYWLGVNAKLKDEGVI